MSDLQHVHAEKMVARSMQPRRMQKGEERSLCFKVHHHHKEEWRKGEGKSWCKLVFKGKHHQEESRKGEERELVFKVNHHQEEESRKGEEREMVFKLNHHQEEESRKEERRKNIGNESQMVPFLFVANHQCFAYHPT